jgi:hypothetical protein
MKGIFIIALALTITTIGQQTFAQNNSSTSNVTAPQKTIQGMVKGDDSSMKIVADEDGKSWIVVNPGMLKNHHGQRVQVTARVDAAYALRIQWVKELPPGRLLKLC